MGSLIPWLLQLAALSTPIAPAPAPSLGALAQRIDQLESESHLLSRKVVLDSLLSIQPTPLSYDKVPPLGSHGQPLLVHLWSIHCPPCVKELPALAATLKHLREVTPIRIILIAEDSLDSLDSLGDALRSFDEVIPRVELYAAGPASELRSTLQKVSWPATLLLDDQLVVRQALVGTLGARRNALFSAVLRLCASLRASCRKP